MRVTPRDVNKRFRARRRRGEVEVLAVSGDGLQVFVDTLPDSGSLTVEDRYLMLPASDLLPRRPVAQAGKGDAVWTK